MQNVVIPWSDCWCIEGDGAWFCAGEINALFYLDMSTGQCELVSRIPECALNVFRLYSHCVKNKNTIYCLSCQSEYAWKYDVISKVWKKLKIEDLVEGYIEAVKKDSSQVYTMEYKAGSRNLIKPIRKVFEKKYSLLAEKVYINDFILVQNEVYYTSYSADNKVYCLDINSGNSSVYEIPDIKSGIYTMCYDGSNFWLGGYGKEICVWNPEEGVIKSITKFPEKLGIYRFGENDNLLVDYHSWYCEEEVFFVISIALGKYVWYIPLLANEIIYIDKETYKIDILEVENEKETYESLSRRKFKNKYIFQYIREDRYIGLYSNKNQSIFEIDTVDLSVVNMGYTLSNEAINKLAGEYLKSGEILQENGKVNQAVFRAAIGMDTSQMRKDFSDVGKTIYNNTVAY